MPIILRVDVDKPFGNSSFINAVRSKLIEDYWYPKGIVFNYNYLYHLKEFLEDCNKENISGYFYYRMCTIPDKKTEELMRKGGHKAGVHAENTRNFESFSAEWDSVTKRSELEFDSFSKHGSGNLKIGKYHYAPYEPDNYVDWAKKLNVDFRFGNDLCTSPQDFSVAKTFYPKIFWIEREYRDAQFSTLEQLIESARYNLVPILIHPENYHSTKEVKNDFTKLIALAKENNIKWVL